MLLMQAMVVVLVTVRQHSKKGNTDVCGWSAGETPNLHFFSQFFQSEEN